MLEKLPVVVRKSEELDELPLVVAQEIRNEKELTFEQRKELLNLIRQWSSYVQENKIDSQDMLSVRYHLLQFSKKFFMRNKIETPNVKSETIPVSDLLLPDGTHFSDYINSNFEHGVDIFQDEHVAIYGGIARTALKLHVAQTHKDYDGQLLTSELPISDIDIVTDRQDVGQKYKSGIAGTRVVEDIESYLNEYFSSVEYSINQAVIHKGKLIFTEQALEDNFTGELHLVERDETLFNPDNVVLNDGKAFITQKGFYRALTYLLRLKSKKLSLYKDNLEALKKSNNVWASPLPKLLGMKDKTERDKAIGRWFSLAKSLGVTQSENPTAFLEEIIASNPGIVGYNFKTEDSNADEIRWIIGQFLRSGLRTVLPDTYPEGMSDEMVAIDVDTLPESRYNLNSFFDKVNSTFKNANFS